MKDHVGRTFRRFVLLRLSCHGLKLLNNNYLCNACKVTLSDKCSFLIHYCPKTNTLSHITISADYGCAINYRQFSIPFDTCLYTHPILVTYVTHHDSDGQAGDRPVAPTKPYVAKRYHVSVSQMVWRRCVVVSPPPSFSQLVADRPYKCRHPQY